METKNNNTAQFTLEYLTLLKTDYNREVRIMIPPENKDKVVHETEVDIKISNINDKRFAVILKVNYRVKYQESTIVTIAVDYAGNFLIDGEATAQQVDTFANINAPAIIFPFVRETIASLTAKGMLGAILVQPVNFVKLYQEHKAK